jgi:hypothetical protein
MKKSNLLRELGPINNNSGSNLLSINNNNNASN